MEEKYPQLTDRLQSTLIDTVLIVMMMFAFSSILENMQDPPDWLRMVLFIGIWLVYEPLCTTIGCTLGNYIKGIRVRLYNNSAKRINIVQALVRYVVKVFLGLISFLTINSTVKRRAIHDMIAGTVMIKI